MTHRCRSGKHVWTDQADAEHCCNGFLRILVIGAGVNQQVDAGVTLGRAWMAIPTPAKENNAQTKK